jgi:hypothetical protein
MLFSHGSTFDEITSNSCALALLPCYVTGFVQEQFRLGLSRSKQSAQTLLEHEKGARGSYEELAVKLINSEMQLKATEQKLALELTALQGEVRDLREAYRVKQYRALAWEAAYNRIKGSEAGFDPNQISTTGRMDLAESHGQPSEHGRYDWGASTGAAMSNGYRRNQLRLYDHDVCDFHILLHSS